MTRGIAWKRSKIIIRYFKYRICSGSFEQSEEKRRNFKGKGSADREKGNLFFQLESFTKTQAFHENLDPISARDRLLEYMEEFRQMQASTVHMNYTVLVSKKAR